MFQKSYHEVFSLDPVQGRPCSVLSIQSHVAYGHVGNSAAQFVMQRGGCDVLPLHTTLLSSHLGYEDCRGIIRSPEDLRELSKGVTRLDAFQEQDVMLLGFLGKVEHGELALDLRGKMRGGTSLIVDPVMGDQGSLYVEQALVRFYKEALTGLVHVMTPNQYELGWLTGRSVSSVSTASKALEVLDQQHEGSHPLLIATGVEEGTDGEHLYVLAHLDTQQVAFRVPRQPRTFAGAGDLFCALLTTQLMYAPSIKVALLQALEKTSQVLAFTHKTGRRELALIASQKTLDIEPAVMSLVEEVIL